MEALTRYAEGNSVFFLMEVGTLLSEDDFGVCKEQILINEEKRKRCYLDTLFIVQGSKDIEQKLKEKEKK